MCTRDVKESLHMVAENELENGERLDSLGTLEGVNSSVDDRVRYTAYLRRPRCVDS